LPAIRAAVAEELSNKYNYTQEEIAGSLGIVQVAVSKYLNKRYSNKIAKLKNYIKEKGLAEEIVKSIIDKQQKEKIENKINLLCENRELLSFAE
jgi:predicted transcriptional regulator